MANPVIFLDRDGVLIHEIHYLSDLKQIRFYDDVPTGLRKLKAAGYLLIMVTNQSGVARGYFTEGFVKEVFQEINQEFAKDKIQLDALYYCPHHRKGKVPYNIDCNCRKPAPGMIDQAKNDFDIDLENSYMLGDKLVDVELGINAGVHSIQLLTGHGMEEKTKTEQRFPDIPIVDSFSKAVEFILKNR